LCSVHPCGTGGIARADGVPPRLNMEQIARYNRTIQQIGAGINCRSNGATRALDTTPLGVWRNRAQRLRVTVTPRNDKQLSRCADEEAVC
jgi:hypothetical protein